MADQAPCHVVPPLGDRHTHTIILLHGRDSTAEEFANEFFESEASEPADGPRTLRHLFPTIRWVFPGAPEIQSERFEMPLSQWFDMWSTEDPQERSDLQRPGLEQSIDKIRDIIRHEEDLIARPRIFLGGISQGFATALATFFADGQGGFAGLIGFCGWMPLLEEMQGSMGDEQGTASIPHIHEQCFGTFAEGYSSLDVSMTPVFAEHAENDDVINWRHGQMMYETLVRTGMHIDWHLYKEGGHWINEPQGIDDLVAFLRLRIRQLQ